jgi:hypothetical protein
MAQDCSFCALFVAEKTDSSTRCKDTFLTRTCQCSCSIKTMVTYMLRRKLDECGSETIACPLCDAFGCPKSSPESVQLVRKHIQEKHFKLDLLAKVSPVKRSKQTFLVKVIFGFPNYCKVPREISKEALLIHARRKMFTCPCLRIPFVAVNSKIMCIYCELCFSSKDNLTMHLFHEHVQLIDDVLR